MLYLPPAFFASTQGLPVIVMVGGTPGGPDDWPRAGLAAQTADGYAAQHGGFAPVLAFVDDNGSFMGDTECVDGPVGHAETYLATDVPRYLSEALHLPSDPARWAIAGFSEGGTCAFDLAARHPDVYGTFIDIAGDWAPNLGSKNQTLHRLYGGNRNAMAAHDPTNLLAAKPDRHLAGWFVDGASDRQHVGTAQRLMAVARPAGVDASQTVLSGGHSWQLAATAWRSVFAPVANQLAVKRTPPGAPPGGVAVGGSA
jgi:S-formylglutathione hydrolase FrmB